MRVLPDGGELLRVARATLADAIAPHLAPEFSAHVGRVDVAVARGAGAFARDVSDTAAVVDALVDARVTVRESILKALPIERRYAARLLAKAIAVATVQLENGSTGDVREIQSLALLLETPLPKIDVPANVRCALAALNDELRARIRSGAADPGTAGHDAILAHLETITSEALSESNPAYRRLVRSVTAPHAAGPPSAGVSAATRASVDAWFLYGGVLGDALYASGAAAMTYQTKWFGYVAERMAANPAVPMFAVEGAHQMHDLSLSIADASYAFMTLLTPLRGASRSKAGGARR